MKKFIIPVAIIGLVLACTSVQAISEAVERGYISVNTSANAELAPDVAEVSVAIKTFAIINAVFQILSLLRSILQHCS